MYLNLNKVSIRIQMKSKVLRLKFNSYWHFLYVSDTADDVDEKEESDKDTDDDTEEQEEEDDGIVWIALFCWGLGGVSFDSDIFV